MDRDKVIPLVTAAILLFVAVIIFGYNQNNLSAFEKLIVNYNNQKNEYENLAVDDVIVVGNVSFWVVSTIKDSIVLNTSDYLLVDNDEVTEIEVKLNETKKACFTENNCMFLQLV
ncbi:MAG: hypothetical protein E7164_00750 [Firmicutes bacterium]|nr:hypothetical protein [Bacillota bacterium]